ncbi:dihydroxy-acid dehydratase [Arsenicitalea aurantiaca]|uniref:Dihydroxy-acid dehydratase n=1 Tax=Arsenicitalea aurantiaca TaxID=1783274 RepID=A0A433XB40_9HYPH|nr:L-arabinonate dehydratase [Arsenicitalea aurantiaca]RUT31274.1 dihydroxy-acid dehydratase [Arsenicitalea aurantiaca]
MTKRPEDLRSHRWLGVNDLRSFGHRSRLLQMGYERADFTGKPVIGIFNTWSDINPCHAHFKVRIEEVKRGIWQAGGFPLELPAMTLSEPFQKPTTMLYRNFLAMEVEEGVRSYPIDGAVLMGGCDKTGPALMMGAISAAVPAIFVPAGPMLRGNWRGKVLGSGSDTWKYWDEKRAGNISEADWREMEQGIARSHGTCMTMGTAATMMSVIEALGFTLPGASSIPAPDSNHPRMASESGRRIVEMVWEDLLPAAIATPKAFDNAISVHQAMGGSTNGIIHILAMARRAGLDMTLERFDEISQRVPVLANIRPSGTLLMEDFYYAGGLPALMKQLGELLDPSCLTVSGRPIGEGIAAANVYNDEVIRPLANPVYPRGGTAILRGNLAPEGAVMKPSAAEPRFLKHRGPALVFDSYKAMKAVIDSEDLEVTTEHVLILRNAGPQGGPGMPEWGMLPIPGKLVRQGVRDMLRMSDARMSGTSYGACVLHISPEAHVGGPLALVRNGDMIEIDVAARTLNLDVPEEELARRRAEWVRPEDRFPRGYGAMFARHVSQAHEGCDFDFLAAGAPLPEPEIN